MENKKVEKVLSIIYETLMWLGTIALLIGFIGQTIMSFKLYGVFGRPTFWHWSIHFYHGIWCLFVAYLVRQVTI